MNTLIAPPKVELGNAVLIAIAKQAEKWAHRDELQDGAKYVLDCQVAGTINGHPFSLPIGTTMTVGHATSKASSVTPELDAILAIMLDFIPADVRDDVIEYVLDEYRKEGKLTANDAQLSQVDELLAHMRQAKTVSARGAVSVKPAVKECLPSVAVA